MQAEKLLMTREVGTVYPSTRTPSTAFSFSFVAKDKDLVLDDFVTVKSNDILYVGQIIDIQTINPESELSKEFYVLHLKDTKEDMTEIMDNGRGGENEACDLISVSIVYTKGLNGRSSTKR